MNLEEMRAKKNTREKTWLRAMHRWNFLYYSLGIAAAALSGLIATDLVEHFYKPLAIILGIVTAVVTFLNAAKRQSNYRMAWKELDTLIIPPEADEITEMEIIQKAIKDGESHIDE